MAKKLLQDMVKVKVVHKETRITPREAQEAISREPSPRITRTKVEEPKHTEHFSEVSSHPQRPHKSKYRVWIVAAVSVVFFLFAVSYLFGKVEVTINPKTQDVALNQTFSASKDGVAGDLPFDLIVLSGEESKMVESSGVKEVARKAEGIVVIYNAFSTATQRLDIDTRLEGTNGKIYKTKKQIIVPGMNGSTPGSVEVGIYGGEAGDAYNSDPLDFKIFGFKGTPKYAKFYARSKGPIGGGFKGTAPVLSDEEKASTEIDLKTTLQAKLFKKATDQIPKGFVLFKDASFLDVADGVEAVATEGSTLPVKINGTFYGLLFDEAKLTQKIANEKVKGYDGSSVYISNIRGLSFSIASKDADSFSDMKNITFNLKGSAKMVWKIDEDKLRADLLGKSKKDFNQVLLQYPNVDSADLVVSPFWKSSLPDKLADIHIQVNYPK